MRGRQIKSRQKCMVLAAALLPSGSALAQNTDNWQVGDGNWSTPANWDSGVVPGNGDTINIGVSNSASFTVTYDYTGTPVTVSSLTLDMNNTAGTATLFMPRNSLAAEHEFVGDSGVGSNGIGVFNQTSGNNSISPTGALFLGYITTDNGVYNFSGGTIAQFGSSGTEYVGYGGTGTFNQTGGINNITVQIDSSNDSLLAVGNNGGSHGAYNLSAGKLSVTVAEWVGVSGTGIFNQTGGTNAIGNNSTFGGLTLGNNVGATGSYNLSGTASFSADGGEGIGGGGTGIFNQTGGTNTAGEDIQLGETNDATGTYLLSGANSLLVVNGFEQVGGFGSGLFNQTGGSNTAATFELAVFGGSTGSFSMSAGTLTVTGTADIGLRANGVFNQTGGASSAANLALGVFGGSIGSYSISGGTLTINGNASIGGSSGSAGGTGTLTVSNTGEMTATGTLMVFANGDVNISGTVLKVGGLSITTDGIVNVNSALLITSDGGNPATTEAAIQQYIEGGQITSVLPAGYGIAYADGSDNDLVNSKLKAGEVVVEPDLIGDTGLNGAVNIHDLQNLLANLGQPGFWDQGNFFNHPTVDVSDLQALLSNFDTGTTLSFAELASIENLVGEFGYIANPNANGAGFAFIAVPEPASAILMVAAIGLLPRRRRSVATSVT
jgi:hypothetical protein